MWERKEGGSSGAIGKIPAKPEKQRGFCRALLAENSRGAKASFAWPDPQRL